MSRGRKKITTNGLDWEGLFNKSVGSYFEYIIHSLGQKYSNQVVSESTPFPLPNDWTWSKFADIAELADNLNIEAKLPPDTLIHYVDIDAIDNNAYRIQEPKLKTVSELSSRARRVLKKGYLMYSLVRPYLNNIAIVEEDKEHYIGSTGFAVFKSNQLDSQFIKLWLLSDYVKVRFLDMISGFNSPGITMEQFLTTWIPVPPLEVQTKLLDFIDAFQRNTIDSDKEYFDSETEEKVLELHESQLMGNQLSTELTHQLDLVKQLRQSFLREAMQGKLLAPPLHMERGLGGEALLAQIKAEKAQLIAAKKLKKEKDLAPIKANEIPFEIPKHWTWCRLGEIAEIVRGGSPRPAGDTRFYDGDIPFLKVGDLTGYEDKYCRIHTHSIKEAGLQKTRFVEADTLMLTNSGATLGIPRICAFATTFNDGIAAFLNLSNVDKIFLYYFLKSKSTWFLSEASRGQGQPNLNTDIIANTILALPPLSEQRRIVEKLESLMQTCDALEASIKDSQGQNQQLLQQVLREALRK